MIDYISLRWIIVALLLLAYAADVLLDELNRKHFPEKVPDDLQDVYSFEQLTTARQYFNINLRFSRIEELLSLIVMLGLLLSGAFGWLDHVVRQFFHRPEWQSLTFFGTLLIAAGLFQLPFSWYHTFRIEEKFGFNRTTLRVFLTDHLKSLLLSVFIGGPLLFLVIYIYKATGQHFWLLVWGVLASFSLFMTLFYSQLIVPFFNKQTPLPEGELREAIEKLADQLNFRLKDIYLIDGSKRSTKANAYFTGMGPQKRIVLYDTLVKDYTLDEILSVLAHEIGHYRHRHTTKGLLAGLLQMGLMLYLLSLFITPEASLALPLCKAVGGADVQQVSFHLGLLGFGILYQPISFILSLFVNRLSRKYEYQADAFAARLNLGKSLISALKKLTATHLSHPDPHPWYAAIHYSHPVLLERIRNITLNS
ncbi:MAG: M48 family metallopeptidase [Bacteroidales bacterium]